MARDIFILAQRCFNTQVLSSKTKVCYLESQFQSEILNYIASNPNTIIDMYLLWSNFQEKK